jgi:4'-phosphopantetheinyl transferase
MGSDIKVVIREFDDVSLGPGPEELPIDVVHVWKYPLQTSAAVEDSCYKLLSTDERQRAALYRVVGARSDFILTRGTLRCLAARYLGGLPNDLSITYSDCGKPLLKGLFDLCFNVSHADGLALIAFAKARQIGVDVEKVLPEPDARKLAQGLFSMQEQRFLNFLSGDELSREFFRCWTRKEAYLKARGEGWSTPLHQLQVSIDEGESPALLQTGLDPAKASRWIVRDLPTSSGYAAALAVQLRVGN